MIPRGNFCGIPWPRWPTVRERRLRDAPESFAAFSTGEKGRSPAHILAHMGDLFDWALSIAQGKQAWRDSEPLPWPDEVKRFFRTLQAF